MEKKLPGSEKQNHLARTLPDFFSNCLEFHLILKACVLWVTRQYWESASVHQELWCDHWNSNHRVSCCKHSQKNYKICLNAVAITLSTSLSMFLKDCSDISLLMLAENKLKSPLQISKTVCVLLCLLSNYYSWFFSKISK